MLTVADFDAVINTAHINEAVTAFACFCMFSDNFDDCINIHGITDYFNFDDFLVQKRKP